MYQEQSMRINQRELASEYGRYVDAKNQSAFYRFFIKGLVLPIIILSLIIAGAVFLIANNSPETYAKAKDIVFANVDIEKFTGVPDAMAREQLDSWLIVNAEEQQEPLIAQEEAAKKAPAQDELIDY